MCDKRCEGLGTEDLRLRPTDQHLVRLAGLVQLDKFYELVIHLGLPDVSWKNIVEQYRGYDLKVMNFLALCEWRKQKYKEMEMTSFKDLSDALTDIHYDRHVICQVFREDVKVLGIDNIALQQIPDDDVLKELSEQVGSCAMQLGVELGLSMVNIEESLVKYSKDMFSRTFDILKKWKNSRKEVRPTIRILMRAIQASDPRGLVFLRDKYALFSYIIYKYKQ